MSVLLVFAVIGLAFASATFTNPLLPHGADPAVTFYKGFYYYMQTTGDNLTLWKTRDITDLAHAEKKIIWIPPLSGPYSHEIWAPELHRLNDLWYVYFAADAGSNDGHRLYVIENSSADPLEGTWLLKGKVADASDKWAIDPTVFSNHGRLYLAWSGWPGDVNGTQNIYLAQLQNPWTVEGERVLISTPQFPWEEVGDLPPPTEHVNVNEGPEVIEHSGRLYLTYSASGCWTDHYTLGMVIASSRSNLLDPPSWHKMPEPVFSESPESHAFGTGHNTFFKSPNGKEDWLGYHANPAPNEGCGGDRSPRVQPFRWNSNGTPNFGAPIPLERLLQKPSGTPKPKKRRSQEVTLAPP